MSIQHLSGGERLRASSAYEKYENLRRGYDLNGILSQLSAAGISRKNYGPVLKTRNRERANFYTLYLRILNLIRTSLRFSIGSIGRTINRDKTWLTVSFPDHKFLLSFCLYTVNCKVTTRRKEKRFRRQQSKNLSNSIFYTLAIRAEGTTLIILFSQWLEGEKIMHSPIVYSRKFLLELWRTRLWK